MALSEAYIKTGDEESAQKYLASAEIYRSQILEDTAQDLDSTPSSYDKYITVGLR